MRRKNAAIEELIPTTVVGAATVIELQRLIQNIEDNEVSALCVVWQERGTGMLNHLTHAPSIVHTVGMLEFLKAKVMS